MCLSIITSQLQFSLTNFGVVLNLLYKRSRKYRSHVADFVGGEGFGLSPELRELCDVFLTVPPRRELHPAVDSLNISVATGKQL